MGYDLGQAITDLGSSIGITPGDVTLQNTLGTISNPLSIVPNAISRSTGGSGNWANDLGIGGGAGNVLGGTDLTSLKDRALTAGAVYGGADLMGMGGFGTAAPTYNPSYLESLGTNPTVGGAPAYFSADVPSSYPGAATTAGGGATTGGGGATATGGAAGGAATSGMSTAQKIALGLSGANAVNSLLTAGKQTSMQQAQQNNALTQSQQAQQLIDQARNGQLNPGDMQRLSQARQDAINAKKAYYAQAGLSDSSMVSSDIAQVNQQFDTAAYQITQQMLTQGLQAAGVANGAVQQAVTAQINSDQQLQAAQQNFFNLMMQYGLKG